MGTLIRAMIGLVIAVTLLQGTAFCGGLKSPSMRQVQADIEARHPGSQLQASLNQLLAPQKDTTAEPNAREIRARGLQF